MRNKERVIQNVENHPEGFNVLNRMYNSVEEPLHDALKDSLLQKSYGNKEIDRNTPSRFSQPQSDAIPNPWGKPQSQRAVGNPFGNRFNSMFNANSNGVSRGLLNRGERSGEQRAEINFCILNAINKK